jgi:hypothetical protein
MMSCDESMLAHAKLAEARLLIRFASGALTDTERAADSMTARCLPVLALLSSVVRWQKLSRVCANEAVRS